MCEVTIGTTAPAFPFREATSSGTYEMIDDEDVGIVEVLTYLSTYKHIGTDKNLNFLNLLTSRYLFFSMNRANILYIT